MHNAIVNITVELVQTNVYTQHGRKNNLEGAETKSQLVQRWLITYIPRQFPKPASNQTDNQPSKQASNLPTTPLPMHLTRKPTSNYAPKQAIK